MPKACVHNFAISLDGYAAGPNRSLDNPPGLGGTRLHEWAFATRSGRGHMAWRAAVRASTTRSPLEVRPALG
jgi:hypothetical protein